MSHFYATCMHCGHHKAIHCDGWCYDCTAAHPIITTPTVGGIANTTEAVAKALKREAPSND